jgi:hypothetical protein
VRSARVELAFEVDSFGCADNYHSHVRVNGRDAPATWIEATLDGRSQKPRLNLKRDISGAAQGRL